MKQKIEKKSNQEKKIVVSGSSEEESSNPPLTESTENMSMNLSSNLSSSTLRDEYLKQNESNTIEDQGSYHNYDESCYEKRSKEMNPHDTNHSSEPKNSSNGHEATKAFEAANDSLQRSTSSHHSSTCSPDSIPRSRPRSGSGGSAKSSSFAREIMRRSRSNLSSSPYSSAIADEVWINDWSQHSTGSQSSFLSSSSIQSRRNQNPMLSRRSGSSNSSWVSFEGVDSQSYNSNKTSSISSYNRKKTGIENGLKKQKQKKQQRINQHREDAVKNYHRYYASDNAQNNRKQTIFDERNLLEPGEEQFSIEFDSSKFPQTRGNASDREQNTINRQGPNLELKGQPKEGPLLNQNEDLDTTFHEGKSTRSDFTPLRKKSLDESNLPSRKNNGSRTNTLIMDRTSGQRVSQLGTRVPNVVEMNDSGQYLAPTAIENSDFHHDYKRNRFYPLQSHLMTSGGRTRTVPHPPPSLLMQQEALLHRSTMRRPLNYHPDVFESNNPNYMNHNDKQLPKDGEIDENINRNQYRSQSRFENYMREDLNAMYSPHYGFSHPYRYSNPDSFESFSGSYEYDQYSYRNSNNFSHRNHSIETMQAHNGPVPRNPALDTVHSESSSALKSETPTSKVSFSTISVRGYDRIIGDNPSCSNGPSLSIGWKYETELEEYSIDDYENSRYFSRRLGHEMILSRKERESILIDLGYQQSEIAKAVRANIKVKNQRRRTIHNLSIFKVEEAMEKWRRGVKSVMRKGVMRNKKEKVYEGTESFEDVENTGTTSGNRSESRGSSASSFTTQTSAGEENEDVDSYELHLNSASAGTLQPDKLLETAKEIENLSISNPSENQNLR